jgi:hypothetical protein
VDIKHLNRTEEYKKECHICHVKVQQVHEGTRRSAIFAMLKVQQVHGYKGVRYRYLNRTEEYLLVHFCTIGSARYAAFLLTYLSFFLAQCAHTRQASECAKAGSVPGDLPAMRQELQQ